MTERELEAISRLTAWQRDYGDKCTQVFNVEKLKAEIDRLVSLPQDVRTCGELSCEDCDARTVGLRAEVERLRGLYREAMHDLRLQINEWSRTPIGIMEWHEKIEAALKEQPCKA